MMSQFFKHTLSLPYSFFAKRKTGDIFARFQENQTIRAFLTESTVTTVLNLLMIFIYFTVMFLYNVKLTLLLIAFVVPDPGVDRARDAEDQGLCARVVHGGHRREVVPDGSARRGGDRQGHGHRASGAPEVGEEVRQGARGGVPLAIVLHLASAWRGSC